MALTKAQGKFSQAINDGADATAITIGSDEDVTFTGGVKLDGRNASIGLKLDMAGSDDYVIKESSSNDIMQYGGGAASAFYHNISSGSLRLGTAGGGISFNGDTATANALDDYEEGTWTPTAAGNISAIANAEGFYTKIGNVVTLLFFADITPASSSTQLQLAGLPYAVANKLTGTNVEGTGVVFEDSSLYIGFALGNSSEMWIELDRPIQGSADTNNRSYRGSVVYYT